ncbi:MAG: hypothetical protein D6714_04645 [Bacteroidetes bacterium]|nr:MAG: hypothetical protein D6714_04645 [Bacteroidota bacterium]
MKRPDKWIFPEKREPSARAFLFERNGRTQRLKTMASEPPPGHENRDIFSPQKNHVPLRWSLISRDSRIYKGVVPPGLMRVFFCFEEKMNGSACFEQRPQVSTCPVFAGAGLGRMKNPGGMAPL